MTTWLLRAVGACKNGLAESGFRNARTWQPPTVADMGMDGRFALHGGRSEKEVRLTELGRLQPVAVRGRMSAVSKGCQIPAPERGPIVTHSAQRAGV